MASLPTASASVRADEQPRRSDPEPVEVEDAGDSAESEVDKKPIAQFVARIRLHPKEWIWHSSNFAMEDETKVDIQALEDEINKKGTGMDKGTLTIQFKFKEYKFAYLRSVEHGYWAALRGVKGASRTDTQDTLEMIVSKMESIRDTPSDRAALLPSAEEDTGSPSVGGVDFIRQWSDILAEYTRFDVEIVEDGSAHVTSPKAAGTVAPSK